MLHRGALSRTVISQIIDIHASRNDRLIEVLDQMDSAREGLTTQLQSFTHNTTEFLRREQDLLLHGQGVPELDTVIRSAVAPVL